MKQVTLIFWLLLASCGIVVDNQAYYELDSRLGWKQQITADEVKHYVSWATALDTLLAAPNKVSSIFQSHSLFVAINFENGSYIGTIQPDIDTIYMVLKKCGEPCEHIRNITQ